MASSRQKSWRHQGQRAGRPISHSKLLTKQGLQNSWPTTSVNLDSFFNFNFNFDFAFFIFKSLIFSAARKERVGYCSNW